jgi:hypothetical protein
MTKLITPAIKGRITKTINAANKLPDTTVTNRAAFDYAIARGVLLSIMPRQQAKHAAKKLLAARGGR